MIVDSPLTRYYPKVQTALDRLFTNDLSATSTFSPGTSLPDLTPDVRKFFAVSSISYEPMGDYQGFNLSLLDLTRNPNTMTSKTLASLVIVARATEYIRTTGQPVTIVTPSSANKATALRDAVLRAITIGLVTPNQLNIISVVPAVSLHKLRVTELLTDPDLALRNPIAVYDGAAPEAVKAIAKGVIDKYGASIEDAADTRLWYTLGLENYVPGDVVRALSEAEYWTPPEDKPRLHVHAVSSAYGLLGHAFGRELLGDNALGLPPRYFLVQHLGAPDMVTSLYESTSPDWVEPTYVRQAATGCFIQEDNPHFPAVAFDPEEVLDTTFYSRHPVTSERMNRIINAQGGGGIVVSVAECMERYGQVRSLLGNAGLDVPANPTHVLEWSLIMALTGVMNAVDRGLTNRGEDILVHGAGLYTRSDFHPVSRREVHRVENSEQLRELVVQANRTKVGLVRNQAR